MNFFFNAPLSPFAGVSMPPTAERLNDVATQLEAALCAHFDAEVITKEDSGLHQNIAAAFDAAEGARDKVAELASFISFDVPKLGLPTGAEYLSSYGTTIGGTVALPRSWRAPDHAITRLIVLPHEVGHVDQHQRGVDAGWWPKAVSHSVLYLCSVATDDAAEYLGHVEADQYGTSEAVSRWLGAAPRPLAGIVDELRRHYAIRPAGADVAEATLRSHYATMEDGGMPNVRSARFTLDWLEAHAADLKGAVLS